MLFLCVEESECIHVDGGVGAFGSKRQSPHVPTDPLDLSVTFFREVSRAVQEGHREIKTNNLSATFREGERMLPMATTDINDPAGR